MAGAAGNGAQLTGAFILTQDRQPLREALRWLASEIGARMDVLGLILADPFSDPWVLGVRITANFRYIFGNQTLK